MLIYRLAVSDAYPSPQSKQKMMAFLTRTFEILQETAKESINLKAEGPINVSVKHTRGRIEETKVENINEAINLLMSVPEFEVSLPVDGMTVIFRYNEKEHYGRSIEARIKAPFKESMDKYAMGFVLLKDILTSDLIYTKIKSRANRLFSLVRKIGKRFLGDAYSEDFREIKTHQFRQDRVYFNIFGFIFSIRTRWED